MIPPEFVAAIPLLYSGWHLYRMPAVRRFFRRKIAQPAAAAAKPKPVPKHTGTAGRESLTVAARYDLALHAAGITRHDLRVRQGPRRVFFELETAAGVETNLINKILHVDSHKKQTLGAGNVIAWSIARPGVAIIHYADLPRPKPGHVLIGQYSDGRPCTPALSQLKSVLIAGTSGSGKTVAVHGMLCSLLENNPPDKFRLLLIDAAKRGFEFGDYQNAPHLAAPIVTDADTALQALQWAIEEMEGRYLRQRPTTPLVIAIDELAGLILRNPKAEKLLVQLAQEGRAAQIYLYIATQHALEEVITTLIKYNLQSKLVFRVENESASRVAMSSPEAGNLGDQEEGTGYLRLNGRSPEIIHTGHIDYESGDIRAIVQNIANRYESPGYLVDWNRPAAADESSTGYDALPEELKLCYDIAAGHIRAGGNTGKTAIVTAIKTKRGTGIGDPKYKKLQAALQQDGML